MFKDSLLLYIKGIDLFAPLAIVVLLLSSFLMLGVTYISGGAGFVRYLDFFTYDLGRALVVAAISVVGIFAFSYLSVGVTAIVKFRRTMDDVSFIKLANRTLNYALKVTVAWAVLACVSFLIGTFFSLLNVPSLILALVQILIWWGLIFLPQAMVLEDRPFLQAVSSSVRFSIRRPSSVVVYYAFAFLAILFLLGVETVLERFQILFFVVPFISSCFLFLGIVPFLEILKCEYYLNKYRITDFFR